eukprot:g2461.t1
MASSSSSSSASKLQKAFSKDRTAYIPYVTAGYPTKKSTVPLLLALQEGGADVIELGVPFSDPLADGETIQKANTQALKNGVTMNDVIGYVGEARKKGLTKPVVLMGYFNPFLQFGLENFLKKCNEVGIQGLIVVDLLFGEATDFLGLCKKYGVDFIPLIAPTTTDDRIEKIAKVASGYVYCVSLTGVTGARTELPADLQDFIARVRKHIKIPIAVGFGLSTRAHYLSVGKFADGAVMGSAIIRNVASGTDSTIDATRKGLTAFVSSILSDDGGKK